MTRINKFLSETGICSRREADAWVARGDVTINGTVAQLGSTAQPGDDVRVRGRRVGPSRKEVYIALHKPVGITCTTERHVEGNIVDFVGHSERIFPIGRLDKDSEGLILLTNDGDIVNAVLRAEHGHEKEYLVEVDRPLTEAFLRGMAAGVPILGTTTLPCRIRATARNRFQIVLTQGLNRQIRRMCEYFGFNVRKLVRVRFLHIHLTGLKRGQWRNLSAAEIATLKKAGAYSSNS